MVDITKMNEKLIKSFQVKFPILRLNDHEPSIVCRLWREQQIRCKGQMVSPSFVSKSIVDSDLCDFFLHWIYYKMVDENSITKYFLPHANSLIFALKQNERFSTKQC